MLCSKDFFNRSFYNNETKEQMWMSIIQDSHDSICSCSFAYSHLLACIFPIGHADRNLSINQIINRDYREKCQSTGGGDAVFGGAETEHTAAASKNQDIKEEDATDDQELAALVAAAEDVATTR